MKPSLLALLIATGAFGASTIYLAVQLRDERARADQVMEQAAALNTRIAELERSRLELEQLRLAGGGSFSSGALAQGGKSDDDKPRPAGAAVADPAPVDASTRPDPSRPMAAPERSEAFRKMMRSQIRGNNKRMYSDVGAKLGLSQEQANALIDLVTDQQVASMERGRQERIGGPGSDSRAAGFEADRQKNLAEVTALIGADKAELYKEYQEAMPARQEVEALSRQLDGSDTGLSTSQRDRMVTALAEERKRVPAPKFSESGSREEYSAAMAAWQQDYNERAASRARGILNTEQFTAYDEYLNWQKEMRQQMDARRATRRGGANPP
jgi:hypothetical protein